jgi:hypothetical protein
MQTIQKFIPMLVYENIPAAAHDFLVDAFGFASRTWKGIDGGSRLR